MKKTYTCSICGMQHVKLWRPYMDIEPLICAACAEKRQSPMQYEESTWEKKENCHVGTLTKRKIPLPKWQVNAEGTVPSYHGPGPEGVPQEMTDQLIVNLKEVSVHYPSGETTMVPAIPNEEGDFWGYNSVPEDDYEWWKKLPTK